MRSGDAIAIAHWGSRNRSLPSPQQMILKQRTNCECVAAKDGLDAISRAVVEAPDLGVDVVMPRMNGFEA
jgi:CheY-like chemotaxis protein